MSVATHPPFDVTRVAEMRAWTRYVSIARFAAFVGILCAPFSLWALFWSSPYPFYSSMLYVPLVTCACVMLFRRVWKNVRFVRLLFGAGMSMRIAAAGLYVWLGLFVYGGAADAFHYCTVGLSLASEFSSAGWSAFRPPWTSSNFVCNLCGIITVITGNAMPTLFVLFAFAALWGGYFFYRAFCIAFPDGNRGLYGLLAVLLPSTVYWSSAIGKDALEQLFIGLAAYGFARAVKKVSMRPIAICITGLAGTAAVRPHVGAMLATSMLLPFTIGKSRGGWLTMSIKILLVPILAAGTYYMTTQAQSFVGVEGGDFNSNVERLKLENQYTNLGGSTFNQGESLLSRMIQGPFLVFRPFPWEAHNGPTAVAALEGVGLFILALRKRRDAWVVVRRWRDPYVLFMLIFTAEFALIFSAATSNFGILVRERIMLVPVFLMFFCARLRACHRELATLALPRKLRIPKQWSFPHRGRPVS